MRKNKITQDAQTGFGFDAPLVTEPVSQFKPARDPILFAQLRDMPGDQLVEHLRGIAADLPDDIDYDDLLLKAGFPLHSLLGWHRSRAMDALIGGGEYQAYCPAEGKVRFRRLPPLEACSGGCGRPTRGGVLCGQCLKQAAEFDALVEEEFFNKE